MTRGDTNDDLCHVLDASPIGTGISVLGKIEYANLALAHLLGYQSPQELIGLRVRDICITKDWDGVYNAMRTTPTGHCEYGDYEIRGKNKKGDNLELRVRLAPLRWQGTPSMLAFVQHANPDILTITQHHRMRRMAAIGTLASGIAHDFNNILGAIIGHAEIMELQETSQGPSQKNLKAVIQAAYRGRNLTRQILHLHRDTERMVRPVSLEGLLTETLSLLSASLPATIEIRKNVDAGCHNVLGHPTQLQEVLMNLCMNAAQSMKDARGTLCLTLEEVKLDEGPSSKQAALGPGSYVRLLVEDTGCGITPDCLQHIFEPGFTTKKEAQGTGLGLAVTRRIVERYHGNISVTSRPGHGSTFRVVFPLYTGEIFNDEIIPEDTLTRGTGRILFVDDEYLLTNVGKGILEHVGYRVDIAMNGKDALACFRSDPNAFDLVITDLTMPGMTGLELAEKLTGIRPGIPILLCTGHHREWLKEKASRLGIRDILIKPFSAGRLTDMVKAALS
ncbi:MAG: response regulator [Desulfobacteraceae bacterium]|jgi:PAS domain S-box-containing protein